MLRFDWSKLDSITSEAVRAAINSKLNSLCDDMEHANTNGKAEASIKNEVSASLPSVTASIAGDVKSSNTIKAASTKMTSTSTEQSRSKELHSLQKKHQDCSSAATTLKLENVNSEHLNLQNEQPELVESTKSKAVANGHEHERENEMLNAHYNNDLTGKNKWDKKVVDDCPVDALHLPNSNALTMSTTPLLRKLPLTPEFSSHSFHEEHEEREPKLQDRHEQENILSEEVKHVFMEESTKNSIGGAKALSSHMQISVNNLVSPTEVTNMASGVSITSTTRVSPVQNTSAILSSTLCSHVSSSSPCVSGTEHAIEPAPSSATKRSNANRLFHIDELQVTELSWGSSSPFVEIVEFSSALDYEPNSAHEINALSEQDNDVRNTQVKESQSTTASTPMSESTEASDKVTQWCGSDGLFVRFHLTYGGDMHLTLSVRVTYDIKFSSITLPVSLPVKAAVSGLDLDCFVCVNLHKGGCKVWLENTETSASPINRLKTTVTFGSNECTSARERRRANHANNMDETQATMDKSAASVEQSGALRDVHCCNGNNTSFVRHANKNCNADANDSKNVYKENSEGFHANSLYSSFVGSGDSLSEESTEESDESDDDSNDSTNTYEENSSNSSNSDSSRVCRTNTNDYDAVFTDEKVISQFLLDELRALLREKLIAPHFINIPVSSSEQQ